MPTFIKANLKKLYVETNIDKYRVAANITEYHIISKFNFLRIIIPKLMKVRQLFHVKCIKNVKIYMFKWTYGLFGHKYRVAVLGIIIQSLKLIGQF